MRNKKRRNVLTGARLNFSQSETKSLLHGEGGGVEILVTICGSTVNNMTIEDYQQKIKKHERF